MKAKLLWIERENTSLDCSFEICIKLWNNRASEYVRTLWKKTITIKKCTSDTVILSRGSDNAYSMLWWPPLVKGCTQPLSSDPKIKLECHNCLPYINILLWGIFRNWSLACLTQMITIKIGVRREVEMHARAQRSNNTHTSKRERAYQNDSHNSRTRSNLSNKSKLWSRSFGVVVCSKYAWISGRGA